MIGVARDKNGIVMINEEELTAFIKKFKLIKKVLQQKINSRYAQIQYVISHPTDAKADEKNISFYEGRIKHYETEYWVLHAALAQANEQRNAILEDAEELPGLGVIGSHALFLEENGSDIALPELSSYCKDLLEQFAL